MRFDVFRTSHSHGDSKPRVERLSGLSWPRQTACRRFDSIERFVMYTAKLLGCRHIDFRSVTMRYAISEANSTTASRRRCATITRCSISFSGAHFHLTSNASQRRRMSSTKHYEVVATATSAGGLGRCMTPQGLRTRATFYITN